MVSKAVTIDIDKKINLFLQRMDASKLSNYEILDFPASNFAYLEAIGPFLVTAPTTWRSFYPISQEVVPKEAIKYMAGLSLIDESKSGDEKYIYQAGLFLNEGAGTEFPGLRFREIPSGKFARFHLYGTYSQLPHAYPLAISRLMENGIELRKEFSMEIYLNTPGNAKEEDLVTDIYLPIN